MKEIFTLILLVFSLLSIVIVSIPILIKIQNIKTNGNIGLNSAYQRVKSDDPDYIYIPIIATNNIDGNYNQWELEGNNIKYKIGGLEYLLRYINILKDEFGKNRVLYLDAGNYYSKSKSNEIHIIDKFFNYSGLKATILDQNDYENPKLEERINKMNFTILSNYTKMSKIYSIPLFNGDKIRIGILGLSINNNEKYNIDNIKKEIQLYINLLKENKVDSIILLTNLFIRCSDLDLTLDIYSNHSQMCDEYSSNNNSIFKIIQNLDENELFDVAIMSNSYSNEIHHWTRGIPIMSSPPGGKFFNILYLPFEKIGNKYILNKKEIKIEGPLPICEKIFNDTRICSDDMITKTYNLINFSWHDRKIYKDPNLKI